MKTINVTMLGGFQLEYEGKTLGERRSTKMWAVLQYLIVNRDREIPLTELIDMFWGDDSNAGRRNPESALKTQFHRTRAELEQLGVGEPLIINTNGAYTWTKELKSVVDAEEFEKLYEKGKFSADKHEGSFEQLGYFTKAIELYKGDFLPKSSGLSGTAAMGTAASTNWFAPLTAFYHSLYLQAVQKATELYNKIEDYPKVVAICRSAVQIDPYNESIHSSLIEALVKTGDKRAAELHYNHVCNLFYNKYNINITPEFRRLYEKTIKQSTDYDTDKPLIIDLEEPETEHGAFYCDYAIFKKFYQIEKRHIRRTDKSLCIALLSLLDEKGTTPESRSLERAEKKLMTLLRGDLRESDVFSRYSVSQFVIMMHDINRPKSATARIERKYLREAPKGAERLKIRTWLIKKG